MVKAHALANPDASPAKTGSPVKTKAPGTPSLGSTAVGSTAVGDTAVGSRDESTAVSNVVVTPEVRELYIVASFNDWTPMRMKTQRTLYLEKYALSDEDIPKEIFLYDNIVSLYANMVPPGRHYFYMCREKGSIFLSPKYEIVRFKTTNVYLNQIVIKPKLEDGLDTVFVAKIQGEEEAVFMKDRSVFSEYREDTDGFL